MINHFTIVVVEMKKKGECLGGKIMWKVASHRLRKCPEV